MEEENGGVATERYTIPPTKGRVKEEGVPREVK